MTHVCSQAYSCCSRTPHCTTHTTAIASRHILLPKTPGKNFHPNRVGWCVVPDYQSLLEEAGDCLAEKLQAFLLEELPYLWLDSYREMTPRQTNIVSVRHGAFEYIFDDYDSLEASGAVPYDPKAEARLVAVLGRSEPKKTGRDDSRLKGWVGPTEKTFGDCWDKGHFIAHSIGGAVDGMEMNVFVQRRDLNRGRSAEGKRFREMETYCQLNPGAFCFSRPLYDDQTAKPAFVEFGVLKRDRELWVECFDNR